MIRVTGIRFIYILSRVDTTHQNHTLHKQTVKFIVFLYTYVVLFTRSVLRRLLPFLQTKYIHRIIRALPNLTLSRMYVYSILVAQGY